jgi:ribosome-associated protein
MPKNDRPVSRSQLKREAAERTVLAERLVKMPEGELVNLSLDDDVTEAVGMARSMGSKSSAYRRQLRFVGKLLEGEDLDSLRDRFAGKDTQRRFAAEFFQRLEAWRDGLVAGDTASLEAVMEALPDVDRDGVVELANQARAETEAGKPPKSSRRLFRYLRRMAEAKQDAQYAARYDDDVGF